MAHRSIRRFKNEPLTAATLTHLEDVAQQTASSKFLQQFTLIRVDDPTIRAAIAKLTTCDFVAGPGTLYVFVLDQARNHALVQGKALQLENWDAFLAGCFDASLAAQHLVSAAEAMGLGTCFLGSVLNDPAQMIALLHLPRYTFPLLGLMVGEPAEDPDLKPRWPKTAVVGVNGYPSLEPGTVQTYDNTVSAYYRHRAWNRRATTFSQLVAAHLKTDPHHRAEIGSILAKQGFNLLP